jgi:hypothetical protein
MVKEHGEIRVFPILDMLGGSPMSGPDHEPRAAEIAAAWTRTLAGLRDPSVQVGWVGCQLAHLGPARAADVLTIVLARAQQREEAYNVLLLRVSLALAAPAASPLKRAISQMAELRGQLALARFLGAYAESETDGEVEDTEAGEQEERKGPSRMLGRSGKPLSLGERKSIARRRDRNLLARMLRDSHPDVIRVLLDNPALVEDDVVRLCAQRPVPAEILAVVFRHPRWVLRPRVRLTLALNPHTPEEVALQLLPHLGPADLRAVAQSGQVSETVRAACSEQRLGRPLH